ncbi:DNA-3-methyladenine glycosylase [Streptoalloteichus tenebrarius]|uniref:Putative 3-methyladenine DNA glycosylase n=1 Tax=Streptoalloteichus tenebrarius (strain ATCC 17920 / DSM 40477 / JCM 4838 / CBS 697.72 / NBRC 16177 / NCIMB 11028 / NRRL B-12390 / A12253. 1 / ISP 5477) TaxID=1933 RepID=A0ABT1HSJ0_STRSD|nr:DNA-3-methyladenine glycosylase [Streptoalloteichus tenebrarius]MCP2258491.1 DNA-3-methyladenine glycosylase [Streptoalloteichus tenebrarius]BFF03664.1 DNA-3-methyladenine glycosylase [Streptoalloteichus tenebrarius]
MSAAPEPAPRQLVSRQDLAVDPLVAARSLLGSVVESTTEEGTVAVRLVEVEAYRGGDDPASHCYRGRTPRNDVMWGPAGHLYVYFVYGLHFCANIVCLTDGEPGAVLLRAGEVVDGLDLARRRRPSARNDAELAKGPARLTTVLGLAREHNGADVTDDASAVRLLPGDTVPDEAIRVGPRVGVATAMDLPWRFWVDSPAVSTYRRGTRARRVKLTH